MPHVPDGASRREFLALSLTGLGGAWLAGMGPWLETASAYAREAVGQGLPFAVFTDREGADFDAFAARIVPTDDTPGAREAGAVHFADRALGGPLDGLLPIVRGGLAAMNERVAATYPGTAAFAELDEERQDRIIEAVESEDPGFFFFGRTLVALGMVTLPAHGGNRDGVGWGLLGFEDRFVHQPPFGYYDRDEHGGAGEGVDR